MSQAVATTELSQAESDLLAPFLLEGLNEQQRQAVLATEGPLLVSAGAGSGKTRVLISRIAHLILNLQVDPKAILGITFTRRAAGEMVRRLAETIGDDSAAQVSLLTFHSLGAQLLREYGSVIGLGRRPGIADELDALSRVRLALRTMGLSRGAPGETPAEVQDRISRAKSMFADQAARSALENPLSVQELIGRFRSGDPEVWGDIGAALGAPSPERFAEQIGAYQASLVRDRMVDYDDLIVIPLLLFLQRPEIARLASSRWLYIMVDEYQDTDHAQDHILRILSKSHRNLCVVGDAAQAIYSWRQAKVENILTFADRYAPCTTVSLDQNYRSTPDILDIANSILQNRPEVGQYRNPLWTTADSGPPPRLWTCMTQEAEANAVAEDILQAKRRGEIESWSEALVLYRLNVLARPVETALQRAEIPYRVMNGTALYQRRTIRDLVAFLRLANNPFDQMSFERATGAFANGIGPSTIEALAGFARVSGRDLVDISSTCDDTLGVRPQYITALRTFGDLVRRIQVTDQERGVSAALRLVLKETGIQRTLLKAAAEAEAEDDEEEMRRLDRILHDISDFLLFVEELGRHYFSDSGRRLMIPELLDHITLLSPGDSLEEDVSEDAVALMTVHAAKGLEARRVYVIGLEEGVFPSRGSQEVITDGAEVDEHMAEEARLFYVSVTRARESLIMSAARTREIVRGDPRPMIRCRFLSALPEMGYQPETLR